ncbi:hypothetical protein [Cellulomonas sp. Leaf395]|uniref:hypothetical protein n=1 Tax=Cellulomonas sp. Leaf395 TaxID=1736362 RepID=UPI0006F8418E|nr:hypothetical protein [Cellulomonas sp. Leaf395]KQT01996.1 hypothetical protein ASG23_01075 [Cellulomonas sp. Leaf395]
MGDRRGGVRDDVGSGRRGLHLPTDDQPNRHADADTNTNTHANANTNTHANADTHADADADIHADAHADRSRRADPGAVQR